LSALLNFITKIKRFVRFHVNIEHKHCKQNLKIFPPVYSKLVNKNLAVLQENV